MTLADAIINNEIEAVKLQLNDTPDLNIFDEYGFTPLIESIIMRRKEIMSLLLSEKADPNFKDTTGKTPLHWAVEMNDPETSEKLLLAKADPNLYSINSQPILTYPILREQVKLTELFTRNGAKIDFARSFINVKLLGHFFELSGQSYIVSTDNRFILVDFEGFYLESSLNIIKGSLNRFLNNFSAKNLVNYFSNIRLMLSALQDAIILSRLQHFTVDLNKHQDTLDNIFSKNLLILPGIYQGHAITFILYNNLLAKCDRGANSKLEGTVVIYRITNNVSKKEVFTKIVFRKNDDSFMHSGVNQLLGLETLLTLPIPPQITGNCSWANVEATIPTISFLLEYDGARSRNIDHLIKDSLNIFNIWREWNKDRALDECIQRFNQSPDNVKAALASVLGSLLINIIADQSAHNEKRIRSIIRILDKQEYFYILNSYRNIFNERHKTSIGKLLEHYYKKY